MVGNEKKWRADMNKVFIFVMLSLNLCSQTYLKASCESALLLHGFNDSHFQSGHLHFMAATMVNKKCENCGSKFIVEYRIRNRKYCSMKCAQDGRRNGELIKCEICGNDFYVANNLIGKARFCSNKCTNKYRETIVGKDHPLWKAPVQLTCNNCGKKFIPPNKNKKEQRYCNRKCWEQHYVGENNKSWVGDDVSKAQVHNWIKHTYGKANKCEVCGRTDNVKYEWANIGHTYRRNRDDWKMACVWCHGKLDGKSRPVYQIDDYGNIVKEYASPVDAAKELGIKRKRIYDSIGIGCRGAGFYWRYKNNS